MPKERNHHRITIYILGAVALGLLLAAYLASSLRDSILLTMSAVDILNNTASSLIVKDHRGHDPYTTFKMRCFYCDDGDYGENWKLIISSQKCQDSIFNSCFVNRTMPGRHETHVLALYRYCQVERCKCTDTSGWCYSNDCGSQVRCCLELPKESLIC
eukprot:gene5901-6586_t